MGRGDSPNTAEIQRLRDALAAAEKENGALRAENSELAVKVTGDTTAIAGEITITAADRENREPYFVARSAINGEITRIAREIVQNAPAGDIKIVIATR